jgi:hypothetical protein
MPYEREMEQLAKGALAAHGRLQEVVFLEVNKDSLLVFADGTVIPVLHEQHGYDIRREVYAIQLAREHSGTDYFSLLAFGYSGTGPTCFEVFLRTAGFQATNVENAPAPSKLRSDGSVVPGTASGKSIEWADGSDTPVPGKTSSYVGHQENGSPVVNNIGSAASASHPIQVAHHSPRTGAVESIQPPRTGTTRSAWPSVVGWFLIAIALLGGVQQLSNPGTLPTMLLMIILGAGLIRRWSGETDRYLRRTNDSDPDHSGYRGTETDEYPPLRPGNGSRKSNRDDPHRPDAVFFTVRSVRYFVDASWAAG